MGAGRKIVLTMTICLHLRPWAFWQVQRRFAKVSRYELDVEGNRGSWVAE